MLHQLLMGIHLFCAVGIVVLVLLQRGKGADAGAGFGAGASGTVFGARGARTALSRATAVLAGLFMLTSLSLAYMGQRGATVKQPDSILDQAGAVPAPAAPAGQAAPLVPAPASNDSVPAPATSAPPAPAPVPAQ